MVVYRIKSAELRAQGQKFETVNEKRARARLAEVQKFDPTARLLSIPVAR